MKKLKWKRLISLGILIGGFLLLSSGVQAEEIKLTEATVQSEGVSTSGEETKATTTTMTTESTVDSSVSSVSEEKAVVSELEASFVTVTAEKPQIWQDAEGKEALASSIDFYYGTYQAKEKFILVDGRILYSLYDSEQQLLGYIDETEVTRSSKQGLWQKTDQYLEISDPEGLIYNQIDQTVRTTTKKVLYQVYQAKGYYRHFDGNVYYSLYNAGGTWQGYVAENLVSQVSSAQGRWHAEDLVVKVTSGNYDVYHNFNWQKKATGSSVLGKVFNVRGFYKPTDGQTYYSLYDHQGVWQGYLDARAVTKTTAGQGPWRAKKIYISILNKEAKLYQGFDWKVRQMAADIKDETLLVNGYYQHINGQTYYSVYNQAKGIWTRKKQKNYLLKDNIIQINKL